MHLKVKNILFQVFRLMKKSTCAFRLMQAKLNYTFMLRVRVSFYFSPSEIADFKFSFKKIITSNFGLPTSIITFATL